MKGKAVMFGAGNIGRGFIGQLFSESGYEVVFVDVVQEFEIALCRRLKLLEGGVLAHRFAVAFCVRNNGRIAHRGFHRREAIQHFSDLGFLDQAFFWNFA